MPIMFIFDSANLELLQQINRDFGITIVIITHQMAVIRKICNRVAIIDHGELVEEGLVSDIFNHPKSKAAKELILKDGYEGSIPNEISQPERIPQENNAPAADKSAFDAGNTQVFSFSKDN